MRFRLLLETTGPIAQNTDMNHYILLKWTRGNAKRVPLHDSQIRNHYENLLAALLLETLRELDSDHARRQRDDFCFDAVATLQPHKS